MRILLSEESPQFGVTRQIARGVAWSFVGTLAAQGATFLSTIIFARILGLETFGKLGMVQSTVNMVAGIAGVGLGTTATRYVSYLSGVDSRRISGALSLCRKVATVSGMMFGMLFVLIAPWVCVHILRAPDIILEMRLGGLCVLLMTMNAFQAGALTGMEAFGRVANAMMVQAALMLVLALTLSSRLGLRGAILALAGSLAIAFFVQDRFLRSECARRQVKAGDGPGKESGILSNFAVPAALSGIVGSLSIGAGSVLLARASDGARQVGIFAAAMSVRAILLYLPGLVSRVTLPVLSNLHGAGESAKVRGTFRGSLFLNASLAGGGALVLFLSASQVWSVFGRGFEPSRAMTALVLASGILEVMAVNLFQILYAHGQVWLHLRIQLSWSVVLLIVSWTFIGSNGALGLALAYCLAWLTGTVQYAYATSRILSESSRHAE